MKKIIVLCDGTDFMIDVNSIMTMEIPVGTDLLNIQLPTNVGGVQFMHTPTDPDRKIYKAFQKAIELAISTKSNADSIVRVELPPGFTLTTDY